MTFLKRLQRLKQERQKNQLEPGKQTAKNWFALEKQKENQPNYQRLLLLTILPLHYFMGSTVPSGILSLSAKKGRCRSSQLHDYRVQEKNRLPPSPSFNCNVLRESLSVESQNIPCATIQRRGSWVISLYLCAQPISQSRVTNPSTKTGHFSKEIRT